MLSRVPQNGRWRGGKEHAFFAGCVEDGENETSSVMVAAGGGHSLALKKDGTLWAWGWNEYGQLGDGSTTNRNTPVQVSSLDVIYA